MSETTSVFAVMTTDRFVEYLEDHGLVPTPTEREPVVMHRGVENTISGIMETSLVPGQKFGESSAK